MKFSKMKSLIWPAMNDISHALQFFTTLRLRRRLNIDEGVALDFSGFAWAVPIVGLIIGLSGGVAALVAGFLELPSFIRAIFATATMVFVTSALHEDGFADVIDGFGGGSTQEEKLAIMRDSHIGSFAVVALIFVLMLRVGFLETLLRDNHLLSGVMALALAAATGRFYCLVPLVMLSPARKDGMGFAVGQLNLRVLISAVVALGIIAFFVGFLALGVIRALVACGVAGLSCWVMMILARRQIGGQTGDVVGAIVLTSELSALAILSAWLL